MQHDNNIENKLREMEAMEQPNLNQVDEHWQQMAGMLQPAVVPLKKVWPKWMLNILSAAAVVLLIGIAIWFATSKKNENKGSITVQNKQVPVVESNANPTPTASAVPIYDSMIAATNTIFHKPEINLALVPDTVKNDSTAIRTSEDSILATMKIKFTDCDNCPLKTNPVELSDAQRRQLQLQNLFMQLEKEEQHFVIDNRSDTLLQFEEGTALLVPANSFGGMNGIEITAKEFYKTSDIILNQLNTMSNKEQLETGGMVHLSATYEGNEVKINERNPLILVLPDTGKNMIGMQLFTGDTLSNTNGIDWKPQQQFFSKTRLVTEARVVNLVNEPYKIKDSKKGDIGYFILGDDETIDKEKIRQQLKEKYGYYKVKLRPNFYRVFHNTYYNSMSGYSRQIGDTVWMPLSTVNTYKLDTIATRQFYETKVSDYYNLSKNSQLLFDKVLNKYSVALSRTGWINCDRFYNYPGKRVDFAVNLGDSAHNYYSVLLFDNIRSMMNGYLSGNNVIFPNIPANLPVKIISIGINIKGETVYSVTHTTTSEQELKGLQFQTTSAPDLKNSLSKLDK